MSLELTRSVLLWCTVINFGFVLVWFLLLVLLHAWLYRSWCRWFRLTAEQFDAINFAGIIFYKVAILLFNLVPYIALCIVR
jgi:hypothetical protein